MESRFASKPARRTSNLESASKMRTLLQSKQDKLRCKDAPNAAVSDKRKLPQDYSLIEEALSRQFIFNALNKQQRRSVINYMRYFAMAGGDMVFEQSQPGHNFFIVAFGRLEVIVNGKSIKILSPGDSFGEIALLHDIPRSATVRTLEAACLWGLNRETFRRVVQLSNFQSYTENKAFIDTIPIFQKLQPNEKDYLLYSLATIKFAPDEVVVREGDVGGLLYIIKEGEVVCSIQGKEIRTMKRGEFFGEQALLFKTPRTATVTAETPVKCLTACRDILAQAFGADLLSVIYRNSMRMSIEHSDSLRILSEDQIIHLIDSMKVTSYAQGSTVIHRRHDKGTGLWMVLYGKLESNDKQFDVLECIGDKELAAAPTGFYNHSIVANEKSDVAYISRAEFESAIGSSLIDAAYNNQALQVLKRAQLFRTLPTERLKQLVSTFRVQNFAPKEVIVEQDTPGDRFFIIKSGIVDILIDRISIRHVSTLDYFGERSLLFNEPRTASVVALTEVSCWVLHLEDFTSLIDENVRRQLAIRIEMQDDSISITDLLYMKYMGSALYGDLSLVSHKNKNILYVLKSIEKSTVRDLGIQQRLQFERRILMEIDHNLITKLIKTFKDEEKVYFLMEYVRGTDLQSVLRKHSFIKEEDAVFYAGCMINMLEHLHERSIAYRDLKPENMIVDTDGYLKLIEFGSAKEIHGRTYTVIGTPHYMSPEVILGKGHGLATDFWSLGVVIFELLAGCLPFACNSDDPLRIYESILKRKLAFPKYFTLSSDGKAIVDQLLSKNPAYRTGGSIEQLKLHPWFRHFDWSALGMRNLPSPFKPKPKELSTDMAHAVLKVEEGFSSSKKRGHGRWDSEF